MLDQLPERMKAEFPFMLTREAGLPKAWVHSALTLGVTGTPMAQLCSSANEAQRKEHAHKMLAYNDAVKAAVDKQARIQQFFQPSADSHTPSSLGLRCGGLVAVVC